MLGKLSVIIVIYILCTTVTWLCLCHKHMITTLTIQQNTVQFNIVTAKEFTSTQTYDTSHIELFTVSGMLTHSRCCLQRCEHSVHNCMYFIML